MADYKVTDTELTSIANAIRTKGGTQAQLEFPTEFVSAIQAIQTGGGGGTNILYGTTSPSSNIGNNGDIYFQIADFHWDSELEWGCLPEYYVKSTTQLLSTHSKAFYKTVEGGCIAVEYHSSGGNWYGPILLSTVQDYVKYTSNENPTNSVVIDGTTWYISSGNMWYHSEDPNATIPLYEGSGDTVADAPNILKIAMQTYNESASGIIGTYAKVNGVWQVLIGTDINDVNTDPTGSGIKGFEVYAADANGNIRTERGIFNNDYFVCFFDDNMSSSYTLNGVSATYSTIATGKQEILATTRDVANNPQVTRLNGFLTREGSVFTASHLDDGSYISVVGGWVGYPSGGVIYESAAVGISNSVTLNSAHETLLIFIGASSNISGITTIDINGDTYGIENIGQHYSAFGMYTAIEINGNSDTNITVTFPQSCWSYVSVIGIDN